MNKAIIHQVILLKEAQCPLPIFASKAPAGFPSPADDYIEDKLNLDDLLIKHPAATYLIRVTGHSMLNEGIHDQDLLIVDRSLSPKDGKIVVAAIDGEITIKKLRIEQGKMYLMAANPNYQSIEVNEENDIVIWGVVKTIIHDV